MVSYRRPLLVASLCAMLAIVAGGAGSVGVVAPLEARRVAVQESAKLVLSLRARDMARERMDADVPVDTSRTRELLLAVAEGRADALVLRAEAALYRGLVGATPMRVSAGAEQVAQRLDHVASLDGAEAAQAARRLMDELIDHPGPLVEQPSSPVGLQRIP